MRGLYGSSSLLAEGITLASKVRRRPTRFGSASQKTQLHLQPGEDNAALHPFTIVKGKDRMDWDDYLRDQAANYRKLAEIAQDPLVKQEHFELAAVCEEVANNIGDRLPGG
jgi:hypothetical protein